MGFIEEASLLKVAGVFVIVLVLVSWASQIFIATYALVTTGEWKPLLEATGGKLLSIDLRLKQDVHLLKNPSTLVTTEGSPVLSQRIQYLLLDDILFNLGVLFISGFLFIKVLLWFSGNNQWDPSIQILIFIAVLSVFAFSEICYSYYISGGEIVYPLQGVFWGEDSVARLVWDIAQDPELFNQLFGSVQASTNVPLVTNLTNSSGVLIV